MTWVVPRGTNVGVHTQPFSGFFSQLAPAVTDNVMVVGSSQADSGLLE